MKKRVIKYILLLILFVLIVIYSMICISLFSDEIWEFGYGYNIATGLVPYRDFNMLATPLFPFCISIFIKIFGPYLLSAHIFNAIILILMIKIMYKMIGNKTLIIIPIILYSKFNILPTYNGLIMFFAVLLVYLKNTNIKEENKSLLSGLIISLMVLTKQSVGGIFFILEFFLTKDKKRYLLTFSIPMIILLIYLITNNALYNFIDYSILGIFDFADKNTYFSFWYIIFIIICIILIYQYKKYKTNDILYAFSFLTMFLSVQNFEHFILTSIFIILIFLMNIKVSNYLIKNIIIILSIILILILSISPLIIYKEKNFLHLRNIDDGEYVKLLEKILHKQENIEENYDKIFNLNYTLPYAIKLYKNEQIDKYDMILNGNMGYNGANKYIKEINDYCENHKCLFLIPNFKISNKNQLNKDIINYIKENYKYIETVENTDFYSN